MHYETSTFVSNMTKFRGAGKTQHCRPEDDGWYPSEKEPIPCLNLNSFIGSNVSIKVAELPSTSYLKKTLSFLEVPCLVTCASTSRASWMSGLFDVLLDAID